MNPGTWLLDLLFPPKCPFCHKILERPRALFCSDCQEQLPWLPPEKAERKCAFTDKCVSVLRYKGLVKESIHRFCSSFSTAPMGICGNSKGIKQRDGSRIQTGGGMRKPCISKVDGIVDTAIEIGFETVEAVILLR